MRASYTVPAGELYAAFVDWCETSGGEPLGKKAFSERLNEMGFTTRRARGGRRHRSGLKLRHDNAGDTDTDDATDAMVTCGDVTHSGPVSPPVVTVTEGALCGQCIYWSNARFHREAKGKTWKLDEPACEHWRPPPGGATPGGGA